MARRCVFCGDPKVTREHAWPQWLEERAPLRSTISELHQPPGGQPYYRRRHAKVRNYAVKRVCAKCNGGWMNDLEAATQPILRPMLKDIARPLSKSDQATLSAWATKTAMMLEFIERDGRWPIPSDRYHWFYEHKEPPPGTHVFTAGYKGGIYANYWWRQTLPLFPQGEKAPTGQGLALLYFSTLCVGHVILQILQPTVPDWPITNAFPYTFLQIRPFVRPWNWPGREVLDDRLLLIASQGPPRPPGV